MEEDQFLYSDAGVLYDDEVEETVEIDDSRRPEDG